MKKPIQQAHALVRYDEKLPFILVGGSGTPYVNLAIRQRMTAHNSQPVLLQEPHLTKEGIEAHTMFYKPEQARHFVLAVQEHIRDEGYDLHLKVEEGLLISPGDVSGIRGRLGNMDSQYDSIGEKAESAETALITDKRAAQQAVREMERSISYINSRTEVDIMGEGLVWGFKGLYQKTGRDRRKHIREMDSANEIYGVVVEALEELRGRASGLKSRIGKIREKAYSNGPVTTVDS